MTGYNDSELDIIKDVLEEDLFLNGDAPLTKISLIEIIEASQRKRDAIRKKQEEDDHWMWASMGYPDE